MVLKVFGFSRSSNTQRVLLLLKETRLPYEWHDIDLAKGAHKAPAFLAQHPFGQVPYLDDGGFVLFESRAICQYLAAKAGSPLLPTGDAKRVALFQQALSVERANFDICVQPIARQRVAHRMMGLPTDEAVVQEAAKTLQGKLAVYDAILSTQKYLAGAEPTLADLYHLPYGTLLLGQGFPWLEDKATFPHLARWWADISSRPAWLEVKAGDVVWKGA